MHTAIRKGIDGAGFIQWSTFDNFEWNLGLTYRFGLIRADSVTKDRIDTQAARFYEKVTRSNGVDV